MTSQVNAKIRLVKCPRCRRVLPELSNVPVYQCGGCDAVLQVKKRKNGSTDSGLQIYEANITQKNEAQCDFVDNETRDETNSVDKINKKDHIHMDGYMDGFSSGRESFEAAMGVAENDLDQFTLKHINVNDQDEVDSLTDFGHKESEELSPISIAPCKSQKNNHQNEKSTPVDDVVEEGNGLENKNASDKVSPPNDLNCQEIENSSPETGNSSEFDEDAISRYIFGNYKKEKTPQSLSRESTSTDNISPPHIEPRTSVETLENKELLVNQNLSNQSLPPNELSCQELEVSSLVIGTRTESKQNSLSRFVFGSSKKENTLEKSETFETKSSRSNSVSSEEILENIAFTHADSTNKNNLLGEDSESSFEKNVDRDLDQYMRVLKGKAVEVESSKIKSLPNSSYLDSFSKDKMPYGRPVRRWTQFKRDEYDSSSKYVGNKLHFGERNDLSPKFEDPEEEKLKLKKMVLELQDQLNRSQTPKGYASGGLNVNYPHYNLSQNNYPNRLYQKVAFLDQYRFGRIPFSAEAAVSRPPMSHSCLQYSSHNHYNIHCPCPEFSVKSCEITRTNDYKHTPKRHVLPVRGGAPFVVCDNCSNVLQLPADFLLFKRKYHQLRCGSCSYVLIFLLRNGYHLDRYTDNVSSDSAPAPPPSEVDDLREFNKGKKIYSGGNCPHVDSMCISEDYGPSICKSYSTEGEPYDVQKRYSNTKKTISGGFIDHSNWRKNQSQQSVVKEPENRYTDRISKAEKSSPAIERVRGRDVSPLHRLMGYNSAREVLNE